MLPIADDDRRQRIETIFQQLGYEITGRTVSDRKNKRPQLRYWLTGEGDYGRLEGALSAQGYGVVDVGPAAREPNTIMLVIRQLAPTEATRGEFGHDGY